MTQGLSRDRVRKACETSEMVKCTATEGVHRVIRILQRYGMTGSFVREWSTVLSIAADGVCEL